VPKPRVVPYPFSSADELLRLSDIHGLSIADILLANEVALLEDATIARRVDRILSPQILSPQILSPQILSPQRPESEAVPAVPLRSPEQRVKAAVLALWQAMQASITRGIATEGTLPGGLNVRRRAPGLARRLAQLDAKQDELGTMRDPLAPLDSVTLVAMAVNEENAAGGRVVTAPTNGAAGVVPAIAYYYVHHASHGLSDAEREAGLLRYFFTAAAIGILYKENASISGAEVGCQGEVGVACSMAAGGLVAALRGDARAIEGAAEIAMEHNLGMTCDPIGGLVQIPCIERNGMGAVKAVNAARLAMNDQGVHKVSLDQVIETMYRTGMDMQSRYKETSLAGLALNIIEC
jgi:L-serine dehydratase